MLNLIDPLIFKQNGKNAIFTTIEKANEIIKNTIKYDVKATISYDNDFDTIP